MGAPIKAGNPRPIPMLTPPCARAEGAATRTAANTAAKAIVQPPVRPTMRPSLATRIARLFLAITSLSERDSRNSRDRARVKFEASTQSDGNAPFSLVKLISISK
jgi:hypothetical protein